MGFRWRSNLAPLLLLLVPAAVLPCALTSVLCRSATMSRNEDSHDNVPVCLRSCAVGFALCSDVQPSPSEGVVPAQRHYPGGVFCAQPMDAGDADCMLMATTAVFWQFSSSEGGHWIAECHSQHAPDDNERATSMASRSQHCGCSLAAPPTRRQRAMHASGRRRAQNWKVVVLTSAQRPCAADRSSDGQTGLP